MSTVQRPVQQQIRHSTFRRMMYLALCCFVFTWVLSLGQIDSLPEKSQDFSSITMQQKENGNTIEKNAPRLAKSEIMVSPSNQNLQATINPNSKQLHTTGIREYNYYGFFYFFSAWQSAVLPSALIILSFIFLAAWSSSADKVPDHCDECIDNTVTTSKDTLEKKSNGTNMIPQNFPWSRASSNSRCSLSTREDYRSGSSSGCQSIQTVSSPVLGAISPLQLEFEDPINNSPELPIVLETRPVNLTDGVSYQSVEPNIPSKNFSTDVAMFEEIIMNESQNKLDNIQTHCLQDFHASISSSDNQDIPPGFIAKRGNRWSDKKASIVEALINELQQLPNDIPVVEKLNNTTISNYLSILFGPYQDPSEHCEGILFNVMTTLAKKGLVLEACGILRFSLYKHNDKSVNILYQGSIKEETRQSFLGDLLEILFEKQQQKQCKSILSKGLELLFSPLTGDYPPRLDCHAGTIKKLCSLMSTVSIHDHVVENLEANETKQALSLDSANDVNSELYFEFFQQVFGLLEFIKCSLELGKGLRILSQFMKKFTALKEFNDSNRTTFLTFITNQWTNNQLIKHIQDDFILFVVNGLKLMRIDIESHKDTLPSSLVIAAQSIFKEEKKFETFDTNIQDKLSANNPCSWVTPTTFSIDSPSWRREKADTNISDEMMSNSQSSLTKTIIEKEINRTNSLKVRTHSLDTKKTIELPTVESPTNTIAITDLSQGPCLVDNKEVCFSVIQDCLRTADVKTASRVFCTLVEKLNGSEKKTDNDIRAVWFTEAINSLLEVFSIHDDVFSTKEALIILESHGKADARSYELATTVCCRLGQTTQALEYLNKAITHYKRSPENTTQSSVSVKKNFPSETDGEHSQTQCIQRASRIYVYSLLDARQFDEAINFLLNYSIDENLKLSVATVSHMFSKIVKSQPERRIISKTIGIVLSAGNKNLMGQGKIRNEKYTSITNGDTWNSNSTKDSSTEGLLINQSNFDTLPHSIIDDSLFAALVDITVKHRDDDNLIQLVEKLKSDWADILKPDLQSCGILIKALGACRRVEDCRWVFWHLTERQKLEPSEVTYGCILDALVNNNRVSEAMVLFEEMKARGRIKPNTIMYSTIVKGYAQDKQLDNAINIHDEMKASEIPINTVTYNTLVDACARVGAMDRAAALLEDMLTSGVEPDLITFSTIAKGYCVQGDVTRAMQLLAAMQERGIRPDGILYNSLLDGCVRALRPDLCEQLWLQMQSAGIPPSNFTLTILIKMFGRAGKLNRAFEAVRQLPKRYGFTINAHVYTCLMSACIANKEFGKALEVFHCMQKDHVTPDAKTYETALFGTIRSANFPEAIRIVRDAFNLDREIPSTRQRGVRVIGLLMDPRNLRNLWSSLRDTGNMDVATKTIADMEAAHGTQVQRYLPHNGSQANYRGEIGGRSDCQNNDRNAHSAGRYKQQHATVHRSSPPRRNFQWGNNHYNNNNNYGEKQNFGSFSPQGSSGRQSFSKKTIDFTSRNSALENH